MKKYYRIAGLTVEMDTHGKTELQAKDYEIAPTDHVDIRMKTCPQRFKDLHPELSEELIEYITTGAVFYRNLIKFDGIMLHASAVVKDGRAYLFTAPSGSGKSTHTELWLKAFGDSAYILNDDKPAIRLENGIFYAYGTPWCGKSNKQTNRRAELGGICILSRGEENVIRRATGKETVFGIFNQTLCPKQREETLRVLGFIEKLISRVPVWSLSCNMDAEAARVSYEAMSGETKNRGENYEA